MINFKEEYFMKNRKVWSFIIIMVMMIQLFAPMNGLNVYAKTGQDMTGDITVTHGAINVASGGDILTPSPAGVYTNVPKNATIEMGYNFSVPDYLGVDASGTAIEYELLKDDFFTIQLPTAAAFTVSDASIIVSGTAIATLSIVGNQAVITFTTDRALSAINGWFYLKGAFTEEITGDPTIESLTLSFVGEVLNVGIVEKPPGVEIAITKKGVYTASPESITWTVTLTPAAAAAGVILTDIYSANQTYIEGTFAVNGETTTSGLTTVGATNVTYAFQSTIPAITPQTITYQTKPSTNAFLNLSGATFTNTATVESGVLSKSAIGTVAVNWINKSGSADNANRKIDWTITVNNSSKTISGAAITDTIPSGCALVDGSVSVTVNGTSVAAISGPALGQYSYNSVTNVLIYQFDQTLTGPAIFKYQTAVTDTNAYNSNDTTNFTNTGVFSWSGNNSGNPSASATIGVGSKVLTKIASPASIVYLHDSTDEIDWRLTVNQSKVDITGASIIDAIPAGLLYIEGSFLIKDSTGLAITTGAFTTGAGFIHYDFGAGTLINDTYTITYKTMINDFSNLYTNADRNYRNVATLAGIGIKYGIQSTEATRIYQNQILTKAAITYNYETRILKWRIVVNRNQLPMTDLVISDTLPAGLEFLPETFLITGFSSVSPGGVLSFTTSGATNIVASEGFTYTLPTGISKDMYTITFDTKVKAPILNTQGNISFTNHSNITATEVSLTVSALKIINNPIVGKNKTYNAGDDYITWGVPINSNKITLSSIVIKDKLQNGLALDLDSVKLYKMVLNPTTGDLSKETTPVAISPTFYTVTYSGISGGNEFVFGIPDTINEAYQLEFITDILVSSLSVVNNLTFNGEGIAATPGAVAFSAVISESTAGGSGTLGSIAIHKVDASGYPISGAAFELLNNKGIRVAGPTYCNADGNITFGALLFKTYFVKETIAPAGYLLNEHVEKFRLNSTQYTFEYTFENQKALGDITFNKQTEQGLPLGGATFTIYNLTGTAITTAMSGSDGVVTFVDIPVGNYTIKETMPPSGFYKSEVVISATVTIEENKVVTTVSLNTISNTPIPGQIFGKIILNKTGENKTVLAGATFKLYDSAGNVVRTGITGADGKLTFDNLTIGKYLIKESSAPSGYVLSTETTSVTVNPNSTQNVSFVNEKIVTDGGITVAGINGSVRIQKIDEKSKPLAGATFGLYDSKGALVETASSGADGMVIFTEIPAGNYTVRETNAPAGYKIVTGGLKVDIKDTGELNFKFRNLPADTIISTVPEGWIDIDDNPIPEGQIEDPNVPQTGGFPVDWLFLMGAALMMIVALLRKPAKKAKV